MRIRLSFIIVILFHLVSFSQNPQNLIAPSPNSVNVSASQLLSLPQIKLWLRADTLISLNTDSTVSSWHDIVSNVTFSATAAQQPTLSVSSLLPGHPSVRFDGVNDGLTSTLPINLPNQKITLLMVAKIINPTSIGHLACYGSSAYGDWNFREYGSAGQISFIHGNTNSGAGVTATTTTTQTYLVPQFFMFMATISPGSPSTWEIYENFSLKDIDNSSNYMVNSTNNITLGYRSDVINVFNANFDMAEFIILDSIISPSQFDLINTYLVNRYSEKVDLGPDINETYSFCPKVLSTNVPFQEYLWSNGLTTPTISVNQSGTYYVQTKDKYGLYSRDTIVVTFPDAHNPGDSIICPGNSFIWNTQLDKTGYTFMWQDSSNDSLFVINSAGVYQVIITDSFSCAITQSLSVSVDIFASLVSLGPDTSLCAGNSITLTSGAASSLTYLWNTSSNNDSLLITIGGQYSVIVTNTNSCIAKDTINVTITGQAPTANFSVTIGCINQVVNFTDLSVPPLGDSIDSTLWNFDAPLSATNTSTLSNPVHTYTTTGTYTVSLRVITSAGCEQSIIKTINIYPVPTATFISVGSCQNDTTSFYNQSTSPSGFPITSSYWNFGDFPNPTYTTSITSPKHVFTNTANYPVQLIVTNSAGCKGTLSSSVSIREEVKANFTNGPACLNKPTNFQSTSIIPSASTPEYLWNFGTVSTSTANVANPIKTYTNSGVYNVSLIVTGENGCTSSITKLVNVYLSPIASFSIPNFCAKDTSTLINLSNSQSGIISSYNWRLNNVSFSAIQSPTLSLTNAGNYSVRLTTINSFGCKDSTSNSITIFPLPIVDYSTTPTAFYYLNETVNFIPSITNANSYLWTINSGPTFTVQSPTQIFSPEGSYSISLNLKDLNGCKGSKSKNITVYKRHLDLAILNVITTKDNDGFMTVITDLANYGSVPINSFDMHYQISDAGNIKETWTGTLAPNSFYEYIFNSRSLSAKNSTNNITCVEIEKVNALTDDNSINNSLCNTLNADGIYVSNPLPNPTDGDVILPITLDRDIEYTIAVYNSVGQQQVEEITKKGLEGLNFVPISTSFYARGAYIIKVMIDGKIFIKKFIKLN